MRMRFPGCWATYISIPSTRVNLPYLSRSTLAQHLLCCSSKSFHRNLPVLILEYQLKTFSNSKEGSAFTEMTSHIKYGG